VSGAGTGQSARVPRTAGFRGDIQGIRGVAVLAVVLYHAGAGAIGGGYAGVDVFFVLSGFLITGGLERELAETGRIRFAAFYARRARRLLPAALLVLVATLAAAGAVLSPLRARPVATDALASALYAGNYRFALAGTDYLNADAPPSPLQHYWSLGVEEQFYLLWPLLLLIAAVLARRPGRRRPVALAALGVVAAASFAACVHITTVSQPWAFFSLPTRAWELAVGGLVALAVPVLRRLPAAAAAALGWAGLATVAGALVGLSDTTPYPGTAALLPVLGTAAVLAVPPGRVGPAVLLDRAPLRAAGRISYSWYLWHWPPLVLAPAVLGRPLSLPLGLVLAGLSGLLAWGTVVAVEDPIRRAPGLVRAPRRTLAGAALVTACGVAAAAVLPLTLPAVQGGGAAVALPLGPGVAPPPSAAAGQGGARARGAALAAPARSPAQARLDAVEATVTATLARAAGVRAVPSNLTPALSGAHADKAAPFTDGCHLGYTGTRSPDCVYGDPHGRTTIVLYGDSHATQWFPALLAVATARDWRLVDLTKSICPPVEIPVWQPGQGRPYYECDQFRANALARMRAERPVLVVLGVARHYGPEYHFTVYSPAWNSGLGASVRLARQSGARVVVLGPTPLPDADVPECLAEHLENATACGRARSASVNAGAEARERAAVTAAGGSYVDVANWICARLVCPPVVGNLLVYRDDNHLTTAYPKWLVPVVAAQLDAVLAARPAS